MDEKIIEDMKAEEIKPEMQKLYGRFKDRNEVAKEYETLGNIDAVRARLAFASEAEAKLKTYEQERLEKDSGYDTGEVKKAVSVAYPGIENVGEIGRLQKELEAVKSSARITEVRRDFWNHVERNGVVVPVHERRGYEEAIQAEMNSDQIARLNAGDSSSAIEVFNRKYGISTDKPAENILDKYKPASQAGGGQTTFAPRVTSGGASPQGAPAGPAKDMRELRTALAALGR